MSDENPKDENPKDDDGGVPYEGGVVPATFSGTLTIEVKNGNLAVHGPTEHPLLCYAILAGARDAIFYKGLMHQIGLTMGKDNRIVSPDQGSPFGPPRLRGRNGNGR